LEFSGAAAARTADQPVAARDWAAQPLKVAGTNPYRGITLSARSPTTG